MTKSLGLALYLTATAASVLCAQTPQTYNSFSQVNLVANNSTYNPQIVDPELVDAWGISLPATGRIWVDAPAAGGGGYGVSEVYGGDVNGSPVTFNGSFVVLPPGFTDHGYATDTGITYNGARGTSGQPVEFSTVIPTYNNQMLNGAAPPPGTPALPGPASKFIFCTQDGCINAWAGSLGSSSTKPIIDYSKTGPSQPASDTANPVFTGCAMTTYPYTSAAYAALGGNLFYTTDFRFDPSLNGSSNAGPIGTNNSIRVFNNQWQDITSQFAQLFQSPVVKAALVAKQTLHPYNILDLKGHLFVTYATWNPTGDEGQEEKDGPGSGHIAEFNEDGTFVRDFNDTGLLDSPWGMAFAPSGFGQFGGDLMVANFGDGTIAAFDPNTGNFVDYLRDCSGNPIAIDGLWGLNFGNGVSFGDPGSLYFSAGPNLEFDGLIGKLVFNAPGTDTPVMSAMGLALMGVLLFLTAIFVWPRQRAT